MTQLPSSQPPFVQMRPAPTNKLGLVGFILSLVGILGTCGLLCPLGALVSFVAVFNRPRMYAVLGLVIGLAGSGWFIFWGMAILIGLVGLGTAAVALEPKYSTAVTVTEAQRAIIRYYQSHDETLPGVNDWREVLVRADVATVDGWDRPMRYEVSADNQFTLISAGPDGVFDTQDDLTPTWTIYKDEKLPEPPTRDEIAASGDRSAPSAAPGEGSGGAASAPAPGPGKDQP